MKTEKEIQEKLEELQDDYADATRNHDLHEQFEIGEQIDLLKWVLE